MKRMKKLFAILMTMAMVMGLSITGFAADLEIPEGTKIATATVHGVEAGATVTAYQLVSYNEETQQYVVAAAAESMGYEVGSKDATVVSNIAKSADTLNQLSSIELDEQLTGDYTKALPAGTYLILVTKSGTATIYNPMLVSLEVTYPDGVTAGDVSAKENYEVDGQVVYAKSTDNVPVDKKITDIEGNVIGENGKYDDVYAGTTVYFTITGTIPSYSEQYNNDKLKYNLVDTVSDGLDLAEDLQETLQAQVGSAAVVSVEGRTITIAYTKDYIMQNGGQEVEIKYSATLNGDASNFDPATNTVTPVYSNSPDNFTDGTPSVTKHYTFDIENALVKVDSKNQNTPLKGAEFTLTDTEGKVINSVPSDDNGFITFKGLDAGTYILTETKAPDGYQLSGKTYTVIITPNYEEDGSLINYTVTIKDGQNEIGKMEYTSTNHNGTGNAAKIVNTTLSELPSTGGMGTTIFTIAGCVIMISAAGLFFASRRKAN